MAGERSGSYISLTVGTTGRWGEGRISVISMSMLSSWHRLQVYIPCGLDLKVQGKAWRGNVINTLPYLLFYSQISGEGWHSHQQELLVQHYYCTHSSVGKKMTVLTSQSFQVIVPSARPDLRLPFQDIHMLLKTAQFVNTIAEGDTCHGFFNWDIFVTLKQNNVTKSYCSFIKVVMAGRVSELS